jgi:hypothetical protein
MVYLLLAVALSVSQAADSRVVEDTKLPKGLPPLVGTAVVSDIKGDEWHVRLTVPKARWEIVGKVVPKSEWPELKVVVVKDTRMLIFGGPSALAESRVVDLNGKAIERDELLRQLKVETPVLVSVSWEMVDPYYLQIVKPGTLVILLGPRADAPAPELLPAAKASPDPKANPK